MPLYNAWPYEYGKTLAVRQTHNTSTNKRKKKWSRNKRTDSLSSKKPEVVTQAESDKTVVIVVSSNTDNKTNETNHKETKNKEAKAESDKTVTSIVSAKTDNKTNETNCKETKNKEAKAQSDKAVTSVVSTSHSVNQSKLSIENKGIARKQPISRKRKANNIDSEQDDAFEGVSKKPRTNTDSEQDDLHKSVSKKPRTNTDSEQDDVHEPVRTNTDSEQVDTHEPVSKKPRTNTDSEQDDIHEPVRTNTDSEQDEFHEPVSKKPRQANYVDIPSNVIRKTVLKEVNTDQTNASQEINVVNVNNLTDNNKTISKETSKTSSVKRKMEGSCMGQTSVRGASILSTTVLNKETKFQTVANVKRADIEGVNGWDKNDKRLSTQFDMAGQNTEGPTRSIKEQTRTPRPYE